MKELIMQLAQYVAPSGSEAELQSVLLDAVRDTADEILVDALGNAVARKHGTGPHIMLAAHADEAGVMVIHIQDDGFLRMIAVGDLKPQTLVGRHVQFTNGVVGVIGCEANVKVQDVSWEHLYADIGADSG
ncbi:MAG: peptidase M42, partial [Alicyclobacillus sp.]|nr:peptidase M42 [Alicyclobacillus sp.]